MDTKNAELLLLPLLEESMPKFQQNKYYILEKLLKTYIEELNHLSVQTTKRLLLLLNLIYD